MCAFKTTTEKQFVSQERSSPCHSAFCLECPGRLSAPRHRASGPGVSEAARTGQVWAKQGPLTSCC